MTTPAPATLNRAILRLAVPALGALVAEPLFLIVDGAMVGHLGVAPLAGLGIASAVLHTVVGLMVFLAYATTPAVAVGAARVDGAADQRGAGEHQGEGADHPGGAGHGSLFGPTAAAVGRLRLVLGNRTRPGCP